MVRPAGFLLLLALVCASCTDRGKHVSETTPEGGYHHVVVDATVYRGLMQMLGVADRCIDFSHEMDPNVEEIAASNPDLLMLSAYNGRDMEKYRKLGIRIIECRDFDEPSALKRLEWMKFYGALWGVSEKADSLYSITVTNYDRIKNSRPVRKGREEPSVIFDLPYGGQWYQPVKESTTGGLVRDASGKVVAEGKQKGGSVIMAKEQILKSNADIWIIRYSGKSPLTLKQLGDMDPLYRQLKSFRTGNVWVTYASENNYYDETPWRPDLLLQDLQKIISGKPAQLRYFEKLK